MAIKISGNTVIDDSQNITATGSATIDGPISLGSVALPSAGTARIYSRDTDNSLYLQTSSGNRISLLDGSQNSMTSFEPTVLKFFISNTERVRLDSSGNLKIGGTLPSTPNIILNADGSATFTSTNPVVTDQPSTGNAANPAIQIKHDGTINGSWRHDGRLEVGGQDANAEITLSPDGSITNKNFINVRNENSSLGAVYIGNADGNAARNNVAFEISPTLTSNDAKVRLNYDGSATFNGETIVQGTGKFFLKRTDAGSTTCAIRDDNLRIFDNPVSYDDFKISLENDGSATFASGGAVINSYGQLVITRSDSNAFPSLTINSAGTTTNTIDLNGDGSATFASSVECNTELRLIRGSNRVNLGGSDTLAVFENNGNFAINWDGSASFDGTITADGGYALSQLTELT